MGIMSATGAAAVSADAGGGAAAAADDGAESVDVAGDEGGGVDQAAGADAEAGRPPESRRARAVRELTESVSRSVEERFSKEREADRGRYAVLEQRAAWLQGQLETMQRQPAPQPQQQQAEDPDAIAREAAQYLEPGKENYSEHQRLMQRSYEVRAERIADARVKTAVEQLQRQMPAAPNPFINTMLAKHHNVAMAGARGEKAVEVKLNELKIMTNHPDNVAVTPEMMGKAFELADQWLGTMSKTPARPTFGQDASAVSGPSTTRNGNGATGGGDGASQLTDAQKAAMRAGGFKSEAEYVKWQNPQSWIKKWG